MKNISKKILLISLLTTFSLASNFSYNVYLEFDLKNNNDMANRYNKIVSDTVDIIKKGGNDEDKCEFKMDGTNIYIKCKNITKNTIPYFNNYVNKNVYNQQDLLVYKVIRTDQELLPVIKRKSEGLINKIKSFFK